MAGLVVAIWACGHHSQQKLLQGHRHLLLKLWVLVLDFLASKGR